MKKMLFNFQLFADDAAPGTAPAPPTEPAAPTQEKPINEPAPVATLKKEDEPKYTDADLDKIINKKFAELEQKKQKQIDEATKLANMNATEKANYEKEQLQKELDELKKQAALAEMTKTARKMLSEDGITVSDELLTMFVNTDAENTKAAVDSFSKLFKEAVESAVKDRLRGETPKTGTVSTAPMSEFDKKFKKYS
jgi:dGTP triphosphohydrolase